MLTPGSLKNNHEASPQLSFNGLKGLCSRQAISRESYKVPGAGLRDAVAAPRQLLVWLILVSRRRF